MGCLATERGSPAEKRKGRKWNRHIDAESPRSKPERVSSAGNNELTEVRTKVTTMTTKMTMEMTKMTNMTTKMTREESEMTLMMM